MASKKINLVMDGFINQPDAKAIETVEVSLRQMLENPNNQKIVLENLLTIFKHSSFKQNNEMVICQ